MLRTLLSSFVLGVAAPLCIATAAAQATCATADGLCPAPMPAMHASLDPPSVAAPVSVSKAAAARPTALAELFGTSPTAKTIIASLAPYTAGAADSSGAVLQPLPADTGTGAFRFGHDFIVMPATGETARVAVTLPEGVWINYWTGSQMLGGSTVQVDVSAGLPPMWARGGSLVERRTGGFSMLGGVEKRLSGEGSNCGDTCVFELIPAYGNEGEEIRDLDGRTVSRGESSLHIHGANTRAVVRWRFTRVENVRVNGKPVKVVGSADGNYASFDHAGDSTVEWTMRGYLSHTY